MKNFAQRFIDVKTRIAGNREKSGFEWSFGMPREELARMTMPPTYITRVLSQIDFAIKLNEEADGLYTHHIREALTLMENVLDQEGAVTQTAAAEAEAALLPMEKAAKEYEVLCVAHAHIDMNWMWGYQETVAATLATFRTMLNLMSEYKDFTFSQSQASVYRIVEEYDPTMMKEIKARIQEGRWEVTASAWVETDKNMPDTESLIRHIQHTHDYMEQVWGVDRSSLNIDFSPDTFGHSPHIPEIDQFGGVRYMYHCRGLTTKDVLYRWKAPSGAEVLVYREPYWYNGGIVPDLGTGAIAISHHAGGLKTSMFMYGVGNHGGGPTRRDVERILDMQQWPVFPKVSFGSLTEYFRRAEAVREKLPVREGELNAIFTGCYTTQSRIKRGNRRCEAALLDAETLSAMVGLTMPGNLQDKAWRNVLFTHFHDILTGSCVQETREHAMGLYAEAMAVANTASTQAMETLGKTIDTSIYKLDDSKGSQSEGAGAGYGIEAYAGVPNPERGRGRTRVYTLYNPCATSRDVVSEITVWDWPFDMGRLDVIGPDGQSIPFALLQEKPNEYWNHTKFRILVRAEVPALGYTVIAVVEKPAEHYPTYRLDDVRTSPIHTDMVLENEHLRAVFSRLDGALISLVDKATNAEKLAPGQRGGLLLVDSEAATSNAWNIGRWLKVTPVQDTVRIKPYHNQLRTGFELEQRVLNSNVKTNVSLDEGARALTLRMQVDWNEAARGNNLVPVLVYSIPVAQGAQQFLCDVPAGVACREKIPQDLAALTFAAVKNKQRAVFLSTDCKYGYRCYEDDLAVTLINTANYPDPYPERGIHHITVWVGVSDASPTKIKEQARLLNHPVAAFSTGIHQGARKRSDSLFGIEAATSTVSALWHTQQGVCLRLQELEGKDDKVTLSIQGLKGAELTDLTGKVLQKLQPAQDKVIVPVQAYSIVQVRCTF